MFSTSTIRVWLVSALTALLGFLFTCSSTSLNNQENCTCNHGYGIDPFEYHLIAANLALYNQFPVYGFAGPAANYNLCPENKAAAPYLHDLQETGPVLFTGRPPVFPLLLGIAYKLGGVNEQVFLLLCALCTALLVGLMPLTGYHLWRTKGLFIGLSAAISFLLFKNTGSSSINAEYFTKLVAFVLFYTLLLAWQQNKPIKYLFAGLWLGIVLLTKGTFVFLPLLITALLVYRTLRQRNFTPLKNLFYLATGAFITIAPWSLFINLQVQHNHKHMQEWVARFAATVPQLQATTRNELFKGDTLSRQAIDYFNKSQQIAYTTPGGFILLTNQVDTEILRSVNNEYCVDGDFHPEWKVISTSFYNTRYKKLTGKGQILHFYADNPQAAIQIFTAKVRNAFSEYPAFFGGSAALWVLLIVISFLASKGVDRKLLFPALVLLLCLIVALIFTPTLVRYTAPLFVALLLTGFLFFRSASSDSFLSVTPAFLLSFVCIVLLIYGDVRFVANLDGVVCFCFAYLGYRSLRNTTTTAL